MNRTHLFLLGVGFGLVVPGASLAETAYTTKSANLRAGPSRDYELVARAPAGVPVDVYGCVDDWTWCDVSLGNDRGWMYAGNLDSPYQGHRVVILGNGPTFGFPIVTYSVGSYWDTYYRGRPWYSRRSYWVGRPAPVRGFVRPPGSRLSGVRPQASRPQGIRQQTARPPQPAVVRPPVNRSQPQTQPQRQRGGRPEAARPQPQPGRAAPAKPRDNRGRPQQREERKPG